MQTSETRNEEKFEFKLLKTINRRNFSIPLSSCNFLNQFEILLYFAFVAACFLYLSVSAIAAEDRSEKSCEITGKTRLCHELMHIESRTLSVPRPIFSKYPLPMVVFEFAGFRACSLGEVELRVDFEFTMAGIIDEAVSDYTRLMESVLPNQRELER